MISRLVLVLVIWAAIYLPGLGTLEIKGEEGRRILPAITMLQTGDFIVPRVGSDPYFTKPPLVNWLVAASFKLFGTRSEWAARLPSVLCVLAVALAFVTVARASLGAHGSLAAALIWLSNFGVAEKGRLIEIEALYVSLAGLAFICWLSWWKTDRSRWLVWTVPWVFLGLGLLAKGPLHLFFFYAVVVAVLLRTGELRQLWSWPHLVGLLLMLAIFAAWALPCLWMMHVGEVTQTWTRQFSGRLSGEDFKLASWALNIPRALVYLLPWSLLLPFARPNRLAHPRERGMAMALLFGMATSFIVVSLLPGTLPRYTMPLLVPAIWFVAQLFTARAFAVPPALLSRRLPLIVTLVFALASAVYAFGLMSHLKQREKIRPIGRQVTAALPAGALLYALDPDYQPALFYVRDPIVYVASPAAIPDSASYILLQPEREADLLAAHPDAAFETLLQVKDYRGKEIILLRRSGL